MKKTIYFIFAFLVMLGATNVASAQTLASSTKHIFEANLMGSEEVPSVTTNMSGQVKITIPQGEGSFNYTLTVNNGRDITGAHLHCGRRGQNGPIVAPLLSSSTTTRNVNGVLSQGVINLPGLLQGAQSCTSMRIDTVEHLIQAMRDGNIYANVHTTARPEGEIRGQLVATYDSTGYLNVVGTTSRATTSTTTVVRTALIAQLRNLLDQIARIIAQLR